MTLVEFLQARYDEAQRQWEQYREVGPDVHLEMRIRAYADSGWVAMPETLSAISVARQLADIAAKRRLLQEYDWAYRTSTEPGLYVAVRIAALPFAAHPDYNPEWKP